MAPVRTALVKTHGNQVAPRHLIRPGPIDIPTFPAATIAGVSQPTTMNTPVVGRATYMSMCIPPAIQTKNAQVPVPQPTEIAQPKPVRPSPFGMSIEIEWAGHSSSDSSSDSDSEKTPKGKAKEVPVPPSTPVSSSASPEAEIINVRASNSDPETAEIVERISSFNQMEQVCHINYLAKEAVERLTQNSDRQDRVGALILATMSVCEAPDPCPALTRMFLQGPIQSMVDYDQSIVPDVLSYLESQRRGYSEPVRKEIIADIMLIVIERWNRQRACIDTSLLRTA